jgi:hypothetical protein
MATDYDAPRKTEEDTESIQALQERVPDKLSGVVDAEDADNLGSLELAGQDLANVELDVVVLATQADEFTCVECFLVKHRSQVDHETKLGRSARSARASSSLTPTSVGRVCVMTPTSRGLGLQGRHSVILTTGCTHGRRHNHARPCAPGPFA